MPENANEHNNVVTLIGELISKVSDWKGVLPVCLTIIGVVMWGVIAVCLCSTKSMLDKYIYLLIYGFFMTIVFLFLIPISEKFFAYKLYEEINKQETNRRNLEVQIYTATLEHLTAKNLSKEDIEKLIMAIKECLNEGKVNDTELSKLSNVIEKGLAELKTGIASPLSDIKNSLDNLETQQKQMQQSLKKLREK